MANECVICKSDSTRQVDLSKGTVAVDCVRCGKFVVSDEFEQDHPLSREKDNEWKWILSSVIRAATDAYPKQRECITDDTLRDLLGRARRPLDPIDQVNRFLLAIADRCTHVGASTDEEHREAWAARIWLREARNLVPITRQLVAFGWIAEPIYARENLWVSYGPTLKGWERAIELQKKHGDGRQAFIAMWFDHQMAVVSADAIRPALQEVGYSPYQVNLDAHEHRIDDKIHAEIRRSRILVAECTGVRPSVYYEAGFANGLGLEVIWCCFDPHVLEERDLKQGEVAFDAPAPPDGHDSWFKQLAFDTRQYTFLRWATLAGLKESIIDRIRARGLDLVADSRRDGTL